MELFQLLFYHNKATNFTGVADHEEVKTRERTRN